MGSSSPRWPPNTACPWLRSCPTIRPSSKPTGRARGWICPLGPVSEAIDAIVAFVEPPGVQRAALLQEKKRIERQLAELAR